MNQNNAAQAANENPLSDEYVNAIIQRHGYDSPETVIARLAQWIGLNGGEDGVTLLMYEAHKALSKLRAPVADERAEWQAFRDWAWQKEGPAGGLMEGQEAVWAGWKARAALASAPVAGVAQPVAWLHQCRKKPELNQITMKKHEPALAAKGFRPVPLYAAPQASAEDVRNAALEEAAAFLESKKPATTIALVVQAFADEIRTLKQPQASQDARPCSCPSGDGSLRHPCAVHPTSATQPEQGERDA